MKKWMTTVAMCLLMACVSRAGEPNGLEPGITLWGTTADEADTSFNLMLGYQFENRFDAGFIARCFETDSDDGWTPAVLGGYLVYLFDEVLQVHDTTDDSPLEAFLHQFEAVPYGGIAIVGRLDGDDEGRIRLNFKTGLLFTPTVLTPDVAFVIDYTMGEWALSEEDEWAVTIGARIKFP